MINRLNKAAKIHKQKQVLEVIKLIKEDVREDLAEIYNNINDDLGVDKEEALEIYKTTDLNIARLKAIRGYTLKVIREKYRKYGGKD